MQRGIPFEPGTSQRVRASLDLFIFYRVRDALEQPRHEVQNGQKSTDSVESVEDLPRVPARGQSVVPVVANGAPIHVDSKSTEDEELELRRQKWAEADLNGASSLSLAVSLLLVLLF